MAPFFGQSESLIETNFNLIELFEENRNSYFPENVILSGESFVCCSLVFE